ncbi:hypothetical protein P9112_013356 [Eukaryota sp. TZLM1-RC]
MTKRYPSSTHSQSPSCSNATQSSFCNSDQKAIKALTLLSLFERPEPTSEEPSESTPASIEAKKPCPTFNPRDFKLPSEQAYEDSLDQSSDSSDSTNVATFEKRRLVLCTIAPVVLETFEIFEDIDPNDPEAIVFHLLSFCQCEDSAEGYHKLQSLKLNLSAPTTEETITTYISAVLKKLRLCLFELPEAARLKFFVNGIRFEGLRFIIRADVETGSLTSFSSRVTCLRKLLPSCHLPHSTYYTLHDSVPPPPRRPQLSRPNPRTSQTNPSPNKSSSSSRPANSPFKYFPPKKSLSPINCFYCKEPGHVVKNCTKPGCRASKAPRKYGNNTIIQRKHNLRSSINQMAHNKPEGPQVNSITYSIQSALFEDPSRMYLSPWCSIFVLL